MVNGSEWDSQHAVLFRRRESCFLDVRLWELDTFLGFLLRYLPLHNRLCGTASSCQSLNVRGALSPVCAHPLFVLVLFSLVDIHTRWSHPV